jgi:hypothetical protein
MSVQPSPGSHQVAGIGALEAAFNYADLLLSDVVF